MGMSLELKQLEDLRQLVTASDVRKTLKKLSFDTRFSLRLKLIQSADNSKFTHPKDSLIFRELNRSFFGVSSLLEFSPAALQRAGETLTSRLREHELFETAHTLLAAELRLAQPS